MSAEHGRGKREPGARKSGFDRSEGRGVDYRHRRWTSQNSMIGKSATWSGAMNPVLAYVGALGTLGSVVCRELIGLG